MLNILFTSVGRRIELLHAFRDAFVNLNFTGKICVTDIDPLAPALREADNYFLVPRTGTHGFIQHIVEICRIEKINLVFPLLDPDIPALANNRQQIEATGAKVVTVPEASAKIVSDKWATYQFFKMHGVPAPKTWLPRNVNTTNLSYPAFIKPRFGSAAKGVFKINNEKELLFYSESIEKPLIQEYLPGSEITNDVICDFEGQVLAVISRQRIEVRGGEVLKGVTVFDQEIADGCIKIAKALKVIGPITVQCILKNNRPYFTEVNARYGGGAPLGIAAGVPSPKWYLQMAIGQKIIPPPLGSYKLNLHITRFDNAFFLDQEGLANAQSHRL